MYDAVTWDVCAASGQFVFFLCGCKWFIWTSTSKH